MSGTHPDAQYPHVPATVWWRVIHRTVAVSAMLFLIAEIAVVAVSGVRPQRAPGGARRRPGQGFTVTPGDLHFILKQIKIAEHHSRRRSTTPTRHPCGALVGPGPNQIPDRLTPYGLRTVDGSCNNLFPRPRALRAPSDELFPRLADTGHVPGRRGRPAGVFGPARRPVVLTSRRRATSSTRSRASSAT